MEGFIPHIIGNTETTAFEYLPAKNQAYVVGQALYVDPTTGNLDYATDTIMPEYFAYANTTVAAAGDPLCVTRVRDDIIYETHASVSVASLEAGAAVTIASNGTFGGVACPKGVRVTATTSGGVATLVGTEPLIVGGSTIAADGAAGCKVYVKFLI